MTDAEDIVKRFTGDKYEWTGDVVYPFWDDRELYTIFTLGDGITFPTRRQIGLLQQLLDYPRNIRPEVEQVLFAHYQNEIYLSVMERGRDDEELTPKLDSSEQIWDVLGDPSVRIDDSGDDEPGEGLRFRLSYYGCPWDEEHGFGIQMQDWRVVAFGGEIG